VHSALEAGYFFPPLNDDGVASSSSLVSGLWNESVMEMFHVVDFSTVYFMEGGLEVHSDDDGFGFIFTYTCAD